MMRPLCVAIACLATCSLTACATKSMTIADLPPHYEGKTATLDIRWLDDDARLNKVLVVRAVDGIDVAQRAYALGTSPSSVRTIQLLPGEHRVRLMYLERDAYEGYKFRSPGSLYIPWDDDFVTRPIVTVDFEQGRHYTFEATHERPDDWSRKRGTVTIRLRDMGDDQLRQVRTIQWRCPTSQANR